MGKDATTITVSESVAFFTIVHKSHTATILAHESARATIIAHEPDTTTILAHEPDSYNFIIYSVICLYLLLR